MEEALRLESMRSQRVRHDWVTSLSLFFIMTSKSIYYVTNVMVSFFVWLYVIIVCLCVCIHNLPLSNVGAGKLTPPPHHCPAFKILHRPLNSTLHIYSSAFVDSANLRLLYYWSMCLLKRTTCKWTHIVETGVIQGSTMYAWVNVWPSILFC